MKRILLLLAALLTLQAGVALAEATADESSAPENPFAKSYVSQSKVSGKAQPGAPEIYRGKDKITDYQRQLERGYNILGYSSFEAGEVPPERLAEQAVSVNADVVLVYTSVMASPPKSVKLDMAKSKSAQASGGGDAKPAGSDKVYTYFASYWTKLPPPILGVNVQGTAESKDGNTGLVVLAVIENSPAATVLQKDDLLLRLGQEPLSKPEALGQIARRYAGQTVEVEFEREGERLRVPLTLGAAQP